MGYIKEPEGVDFVINGKPLTAEQKQAISEYIKADKAKTASLTKKPRRVVFSKKNKVNVAV
jgi:hypothetical protein